MLMTSKASTFVDVVSFDDHVTPIAMQADAILRSGIRKFTDMVGKLWNSLADFYIRRGNFDKVNFDRFCVRHILELGSGSRCI